ncbi:MAG: DUF883 C-terminal domain-containing protein [Chloroflexota bacterium]|nr:DUF883 C-terminal domain-containing protein [Chloroflexota bacterium]
MEPSSFDDLLAGWRQFSDILSTVYKDITGENLDLESAVRHYPLLTLGAAAGVGFVAGQFLARRSQTRLPESPPPRQPELLPQFPAAPLERLRELLPEWNAEEAEAQARAWIDTVVEPRLRETFDNSRLGAFFRRTIEGQGREHDATEPEEEP